MASRNTNVRIGVDARISPEVRRATESLNRQTQTLRRELRRSEGTVNRQTRALNRMSRAARNSSSSLGNLRSTLVALGGAAVFGRAIRVAAEFENTLIGIRRTAGLTTLELERISESIRTIALDTGISATRLAELGIVAGQLGITGTAQIGAFIRTMGFLERATNLAGEAGAIAFGRLLLALRIPVEEAGRLGDAITTLGNRTAITETELVSLAQEIASQTSVYNVSAEGALALSATFGALGIEAGAVLGPLRRITIQLRQVEGAALSSVAAVSGLTNNLVQDLARTDPIELLRLIVTGLEAQGLDSSVFLQRLGGRRNIQDIAFLDTLVGNLDSFDENLQSSNEGLAGNNALTEEASLAFMTLQSTLGMLSNAFVEFSIFVGQELQDEIEAVTRLFRVLAENVEFLSRILTAFTVFAASFFAIRGLINIPGVRNVGARVRSQAGSVLGREGASRPLETAGSGQFANLVASGGAVLVAGIVEGFNIGIVGLIDGLANLTSNILSRATALLAEEVNQVLDTSERALAQRLLQRRQEELDAALLGTPDLAAINERRDRISQLRSSGEFALIDDLLNEVIPNIVSPSRVAAARARVDEAFDNLVLLGITPSGATSAAAGTGTSDGRTALEIFTENLDREDFFAEIARIGDEELETFADGLRASNDELQRQVRLETARGLQAALQQRLLSGAFQDRLDALNVGATVSELSSLAAAGGVGGTFGNNAELIRAAQETQEDAENAEEELRQSFRRLGDGIAAAVGDFVTGISTLGDLITSVVRNVINEITRSLVVDPFSDALTDSIIPRVFSFFGGTPPTARAQEGGIIRRGGFALVGEQGPEIVRLGAGDEVFPNGFGPGGSNLTINVQGDANEGQIRTAVNAALAQAVPSIQQGILSDLTRNTGLRRAIS